MSHSHCVVVGCTSDGRKKEPGVRFFRFPGKWYEKELKERWIRAIRRKNPDGSQWRPSHMSRVCSKHFLDGVRSNIADNPSNCPTIFPEVYRSRTSERAERRKKRNLTKRREEAQFETVQPQDTTHPDEEDEVPLSRGLSPHDVDVEVLISEEVEEEVTVVAEWLSTPVSEEDEEEVTVVAERLSTPVSEEDEEEVTLVAERLSSPEKMPSCFVPGCWSGCRPLVGEEAATAKVSFFKPPETMLKAWEDAIAREDRRLERSDRLCEKHFLEEDIVKESVRTDPDGATGLKPGAIPQLFPVHEELMATVENSKSFTKRQSLKAKMIHQGHAGALKRRKKATGDQGISAGDGRQYLSRSDPPEMPVNGNSSKKLRPSRQGKKRKRGKTVKDELEGDLVTSAEPIEETHCISIGTQVDFDFPETQFTFICDRSDSVTVGVQCNLPPSTTISNANQCRGFHSYRTVKGDDEGLSVLCGVNWVTFELLKDRFHSELSFVLDNASVLLLFLMKLRLGLPFAALGILFGIHRGMAKDVFLAVLDKLCSATAGYWPPMLEVKNELPPFFQGKYAATRLIVGCVEVKAQRLDKLEHRIPMYSTRGEQYAFKILIGVTPTGLISQKSKVYCGRTSDSFIARDSRLLDLLEPGDFILTDSRFPADIDDRICPIPPPPDDDCCTPEELKLDEVRLHVEMCLERVKQFKILHFMPRSLFVNIDAILHLCCLLVNHMPPIFEIRDRKFHLIENEEF